MYYHPNTHIVNADKYQVPQGAKPVFISSGILEEIVKATGYRPKSNDGLFVVRVNGREVYIAVANLGESSAQSPAEGIRQGAINAFRELSGTWLHESGYGHGV